MYHTFSSVKLYGKLATITFVFDGIPSSGGPRWRIGRAAPEFSAPAAVSVVAVVGAAVAAADPSEAFWALAAWVVLS